MKNKFLTAAVLAGVPIGFATADVIDSSASGNWNEAGVWAGGTVPQTGAGDSANILAGHTVIYTDATPRAGLDGSNDLGVGNGNSININGGVLSQAMDGWWVRIGHKGAGTLNIMDGRFHVTNGNGGGTNMQVGVDSNGNGVINVGDGTGAAGSAVLNLRDKIDGSLNGGAFTMNLAASANTVGRVTIHSDGVFEGDQRVWNGSSVTQDPHIRIGQQSSSEQSVFTVGAGGQFNARGTVEVGANGGSKGLLLLSGTGARMDMSDGELNIGFNGSGEMRVENGAVFSRSHTSAGRSDQYVGRATGTGVITVGNGGEFRRGSGGNVGDMRIGYEGVGTLNVESGGLYRNESGNWDWLGQNASGVGTVNVNGGTYEITSGSNLVIGVNGTGVFNHNSGVTNVSGIRAGVNNGSGEINIRDGEFRVRSGFYLGGDGTGSGGNGSAVVNQTGGQTSIGAAFVIGIASNHSGTYNLDGGSVIHTGSDISVGESGHGTLVIAAGASLEDTSTGSFFVGRNSGSSGVLIVDGVLSKTGGTKPLRVGNGNADGVDNTSAPGLLGGRGSITAENGVHIGAHGTLTGAGTGEIGALSITGDLIFSAGGVLHVDLDGAGANDVIEVAGTIDITAAVLDGSWLPGAEIGPDSRYWILLNDGEDAITGTFANATLSSPNAGLFPDAGGFVTFGGQEFAVFYQADHGSNSLTGGNDLLLSAIPEPSAAGLLLLAGLGAFRRRRG